jgi:uncharacterized protein YdaU (DUF1376 family)
MPLDVAAYLADTFALSMAEHGAYMLLLMHAWQRGGILPDDDTQLSKLVRASVREWKTLRATLAPFFTVADGEWRQKRLLMELAEAKARAATAGVRAAEANAVRWGKEGPPDDPIRSPPSNADSKALSNADGSPSPAFALEPLSLGSKALKAKKKIETQIPKDFGISERVRAWADRKGFEKLDDYLEIFVGRNTASGKVYADWDQAFMNAIREDWYGVRKAKPGNGNGAGIVPDWWASDTGTKQMGEKLGMSPRGGESWNEFRGRIRERLRQSH